MNRPPTALLLAAGLATRLGPLRERYPKACVPVAGTTPLAFALHRLHAAGVRRAWINLHHHGAHLRAAAERAVPATLELRFLDEPQLLGTGGTLLALAQRAGALPDLVLNAKIFTDYDFARSLAEPRPHFVLYPDGDLAAFGGLRYVHDQVAGLRRAGAPAQEPGVAVYTGIARPDPAWLPHLEAARAGRPEAALCMVRDGLLPALAQGRAPAALLHHGYWMEISTPERVAAAEARLKRAAPPGP